jgi:hypothetical protein
MDSKADQLQWRRFLASVATPLTLVFWFTVKFANQQSDGKLWRLLLAATVASAVTPLLPFLFVRRREAPVVFLAGCAVSLIMFLFSLLLIAVTYGIRSWQQ